VTESQEGGLTALQEKITPRCDYIPLGLSNKRLPGLGQKKGGFVSKLEADSKNKASIAQWITTRLAQKSHSWRPKQQRQGKKKKTNIVRAFTIDKTRLATRKKTKVGSSKIKRPGLRGGVIKQRDH